MAALGAGQPLEPADPDLIAAINERLPASGPRVRVPSGDDAAVVEAGGVSAVSVDAVVESEGTEQPGTDPSDAFMFTIDDDICTRCALCVDRCPTGVIILGKAGTATAAGNSHVRTNNHGYGYGMRL
jgi:NAD-dependent dihydropyrimidine dehydrogenase PreA subunit